MKKILSILLSAVMIFCAVPVLDLSACAAEPAINTSKIEIYGLDTWEEKNISIPSGYQKSFQLSVSGAADVEYSVTEGDSVTVSEDGLVEAKYQYCFWKDGVGTTVPVQGVSYDEITKSGKYGVSKIEITADGQKFYVSADFRDYGDVYTQNVIEEYISSNITDDMTAEQLMNAIAAFPAENYSYSANQSTCKGMVISGAGDSQASTDSIIRLCNELGISAWKRKGNKVSAHVNAVVEYDSIYYQLEAGYAGDAPRAHNVSVRSSVYDFENIDGGISIYQYCGNPSAESIVIPEKINGMTVVEIGKSVFSTYNNIAEVTIANTVENIGESAFSGCSSLEKITIPQSVSNIDNGAFYGCNLKTVNYSGTKNDWNKITIGTDNNPLTNASFNYYCDLNGGHKWDNGVITASTCTEAGTKTYTCTECGETKTEAISKKTHIYKPYVTKATTKKNGSVVTKCSVCGTVKSAATIYYPKTIKLSSTSYTYNGKVKTPAVTVKDSKGKTLKKNTDYTVTYSKGRKNVGKYTVTIKFKGNYSGTVKKTFTIKPKATSISKLTAGKKKFTVKWKKLTTQTTGYQIQYSTSSKFTAKTTKYLRTGSSKTTSKTISKLKAKKKYYIRVRTYKTVKINGKNTRIYSSWSKAKSVTTKK